MSTQPKIIIAGAGFGGLTVAKELADTPFHVTVIDRSNHHLFQPLLYQVATAALSPAQIAQPVRHILRDARNIEVVMAGIQKVDAEKKQVITEAGAFEYDTLILATGARHSYFGNPEWEKDAPGLKSIDDALELRRRLLFAFEEAEMVDDPKAREAALTFVVVGGGPTGVEMAGAIAEVARYTMVQDFRRIDPSQARVILIDAAPRVLPGFAEVLSQKALEQLNRTGVEVRTSTAVKNVSPEGVEVEGEFIPCRTVVWAAGNAASPLGKDLGVETDRAGRVIVNADLTVPGHPDIFVIGDLACYLHQGGKALPGVSPVAMQQGRYVARLLRARYEGREIKPFHYFDKGSMATIGRHAAVADVRGLRFNGYAAWLAWLFVHLIFLLGFRNRVLVFLQWTWSYLNFYRGARLITGTTRKIRPDPVPPSPQRV